MTTTPKTLTVLECHQLLDALLVKDSTPKRFRKGVRNFTMALLMLDAGLRVGEVVGLRQYDLFYIDRPREAVFVSKELGHGKLDRSIPLSVRIRNSIISLHDSCWIHDFGPHTDYAFFTPSSPKPLTTRQVERIIRTAALKSIGRPVHPHILRHTFATRLMRTTNIRIVQELLGHQFIASTQIYTHPNQDDLVKAIEDLNLPAATVYPDKPPLPA